MDEPYKRPDRHAIAARVRAEQAAAAAHEPATSEAAPPPEPEPARQPAGRCKGCGYLTTSLGHYWHVHG